MSIKQNFHNEQMRDSKIDVLNQLKNREMRNKLLHYQIPRLNGTQKGIKIFGESQIFNKDCVSGGSNITYSSNLNNNDYEKYRKQILQTRVDSLQAMKAPEGMAVPQQVELSQNEGDKLAANMLLDKILRTSSEGTPPSIIVADIYKYMKYLVDNIYFFDDYRKFTDLINTFNEIHASISGSMMDYTKDVSTLIDNIIDYIEYNMKGVGMDIKRRQIMAKSTIPLFKLKNLERNLRRTPGGAAIIAAAAAAVPTPTATPATTRAATPVATPAATPVATPAPTPPPSRPPSPPPERPLTKLQKYKIFIIKKSVDAGITDETHIKEIERIAVNYLKLNKKVLTENELENLIQNYIDFMRQAPVLDYDLTGLD